MSGTKTYQPPEAFYSNPGRVALLWRPANPHPIDRHDEEFDFQVLNEYVVFGRLTRPKETGEQFRVMVDCLRLDGKRDPRRPSSSSACASDENTIRDIAARMAQVRRLWCMQDDAQELPMWLRIPELERQAEPIGTGMKAWRASPPFFSAGYPFGRIDLGGAATQEELRKFGERLSRASTGIDWSTSARPKADILDRESERVTAGVPADGEPATQPLIFPDPGADDCPVPDEAVSRTPILTEAEFLSEPAPKVELVETDGRRHVFTSRRRGFQILTQLQSYAGTSWQLTVTATLRQRGQGDDAATVTQEYTHAIRSPKAPSLVQDAFTHVWDWVGTQDGLPEEEEDDGEE